VSCTQSVVDGIPTGQYHCTHRDAAAARPKAAKAKKKAKAKPKKAKKAAKKAKKAVKKAKKAAKKAKKAKGKKKKEPPGVAFRLAPFPERAPPGGRSYFAFRISIPPFEVESVNGQAPSPIFPWIDSVEREPETVIGRSARILPKEVRASTFQPRSSGRATRIEENDGFSSMPQSLPFR